MKLTHIMTAKVPASEMARAKAELEKSGYIVELENREGNIVLVIKRKL